MARIGSSSIITITVIAISLLTAANLPCTATSAAEDETIRSGANLPAVYALPAETDVIVVMPHLKILSDQITQSLEGMDRANLLIGSRPLDQLKAALGFNVGVNDLGSLAIGITRGEHGELVTTFVVPVSDAEAFLNGNFTARNGDALTLPTGRVVYGKVFDAHVIISTSAPVIQNHPPVRSAVERLAEFSDQTIAAMVNHGEMFMVVNEAGLSDTMVRALTMPPFDQLAIRADDVKRLFTHSCVESAIISVDFDALGLIVRSMVRFKPDSPMSALTARPSHTMADDMGHLPNKSYFAAGSVDAEGQGGAVLHRMIAAALGLDVVPPWLSEVQGVQFASYPSSAGVAGGLLNDAAIILQTPHPDSLRSALRTHVIEHLHAATNSECSVQWEEGLDQGEVIGKTDGYEVHFTDLPPNGEHATKAFIRQLLFGRIGWRGFVKPMSESVIVTLSRRPAALEVAMKARTGDDKGLGSLPAFRTMRRMFPSGYAAEMYLSVSSIAAFATQVAASVGQAGALPTIEANLPPIGLSAAARTGAIESAMIIPSGVLAAALDEVMRRRAAVPEPDPK